MKLVMGMVMAGLMVVTLMIVWALWYSRCRREGATAATLRGSTSARTKATTKASTNATRGSTAATTTAVTTSETSAKASSKYVVQTGAKPPPCGWHGCFVHPKKPGAKLPSRNLSNGQKWMDIAGLTESNVPTWPRYNGQQFWNPYALNGREEDGGIINPPGVMPVVDPPKDRYIGPYWMKPSWQTGSTDLANYYQQKCAKRVKTPGRLYYVGPVRSGREGVQVGGYVWVVHPRNDAPSGEGWTHFIPQPRESPVEAPKYRNEDAADLLKQGAELPPWSRRGPHAAEQAIRAYCK